MKPSPRKTLFNIFSSQENTTEAAEPHTEIVDPNFDDYEQQIIKNLSELKNRTAEDVMIPKADIIAVEVKEPLEDVARKLSEKGYKRLPVYRETLDDAIGLVWIHDVLSWCNGDINAPKELSQMIRPVLFVSPFMGVLELLMEMRIDNRHMALVVDEFGGVDGLITLENLLEEIVGEINDERSNGIQTLFRIKGNTPELHARLSLEELEDRIGPFLQEDEREYIDTVGGLVFSLAGRVPAKGEIISHPSGLEFEIIGVDPRKVHWVRLMGKNHGEKINFDNS